MIDWKSVEDTSRYGNDSEPPPVKMRECPDCEGKGGWLGSEEPIICEYCGGIGEVEDE